MKKATIILGFITVALITTAAAFKLTHLPGAGALLAITGTVLSAYFAFHVIDILREKGKEISGVIQYTAAFCVGIINLGITCRIRHWTGADPLLIIGLLGFSLVLVPQLLIHKMKQPGSDTIRNIAGALALSCFGTGVLFKLEYWPGASVILTLVPVLLLLVYFPRYILDNSIASEVKHRYLRSAFFTIVVGSLISMYMVLSIETHDKDNVPDNTWYQNTVAARTK